MSAYSLDLRNRSKTFAAMEEQIFDLLVIGAGITGAGVARDAAMRGLSVALVDANDIGAGTSSRSSKLIHGGMRYLAAGHVSIVREAAIERKVLRRVAPHLAQTTRMLLPTRSRGAMLTLKAALLTYEKLGEVAPSERHEIWDVDRLRREEPAIIVDGLRGAVAYPEYVTDDARLVLANVRSAAERGAAVLTYARVDEILVEDGCACGAIVRDTLSGGDLGARIRAKTIVNAAGPWLDAVRKLEDRAAPGKLQLTKGIHVTLMRERLPIASTVVMRASDKRSVFVVPRGRFVYFGTTDTFYPEAGYWPDITREDVDYLLEAGARMFHAGPFQDQDIVSLWSGVRPLLAQKGKHPSEISRRNEIIEGPSGVMSIAGGKLTSYRSMAQRIVDSCLERLGESPRVSTAADEALPGGDIPGGVDALEASLRASGLSDEDAERSARLYGSEAEEVFAEGTGCQAEARWAVLREGALTLEDYWVRRSVRARFDDDGGTASLEPASTAMAELLDWSDEERRSQIEACLAIRGREMQVVLAQGAELGVQNS